MPYPEAKALLHRSLVQHLHFERDCTAVNRWNNCIDLANSSALLILSVTPTQCVRGSVLAKADWLLTLVH